MNRRLAIALLILVSLTLPSFARGRKTVSKEPGTYKEWGPDIDEIEIVKTFSTNDYEKIVVTPFNTASTPLPDEKEDSYKAIKAVLDDFTPEFTTALQKELKASAKVEEAKKAPKKGKVLVLRAKVESIDPGSRAARYWAGFGAGAAGTKISGEIADAATGAVLIRFTQARRSGGTWKFAGGNDTTVMKDSIHALAQDVAHLLDTF
ncbi:MAG TPA: DUF4410 domain-containing protein [Thermoanaerobaculia bacterium]|nr:DUF4410 domain-containing protein [Thermoanaerobaculia bacterium]